MTNYIFKTMTTLKEYNCNKYWIDRGYIPQITIAAENLKAAIEQFRTRCKNDYYVSISDHAIKNKNAMYIDLKSGESKQIGYVITGKTSFDNNGKWTDQFIELWTEIREIRDVNF